MFLPLAAFAVAAVVALLLSAFPFAAVAVILVAAGFLLG